MQSSVSATPKALAAPPELATPATRRWGAFTLLLSATLVALSVYWAEPSRVLDSLARVNLAWWWAAFALSWLQLALFGLRWRTVARLSGLRITLGRACREYALSVAMNQLLPLGMLGDGLRALRQRSATAEQPFSRVLEAVAIDRLAGQEGLWLTVALALPLTARSGVFARAFGPSPLASLTLAHGLALLVAVAGAVGLARFARRRLSALGDSLGRITAALLEPRHVVRHLPLSLGLTACLLLQLQIAARALGVALPASELLALGPLMLLASSLPSFFGGWGIREAAGALLFAGAGAHGSTGVAISLVYGSFALVASLPALLVPLLEAGALARDRARPSASPEAPRP